MKRFFLLFTLFFAALIGCESNSANNKVKVENTTNKNLICVLGYNYPDLTFSFTNKQALLSKSNLLTVDAGQTKEIDTLGFCKKEVFDSNIKHSMLMLMVFDKDKLATSDKLEDALVERYYFTYIQLKNLNGVIPVK